MFTLPDMTTPAMTNKATKKLPRHGLNKISHIASLSRVKTLTVPHKVFMLL